MAFMDEKIRGEALKILDGMETDVSLILFTSREQCEFCDHTRELIYEVAALTDKLTVEFRDLEADREVAEHFRVDRAPGLVVMGERDKGIRFYGIPSGFEFGTLLETIRMVSTGDAGLNEATTTKLESLDGPVLLQVFITPTCPYCAGSVLAANRLAMASDKVTSEMIEAMEFPELSQKHSVMSVPRTVLNSEHAIDGAVPESYLIDWIIAESSGGAA